MLLIEGRDALFESNAIVEYLDDVIPPMLHPQDPVARARNRAWTDFIATFARTVLGPASATTETEYLASVEKLAGGFGLLEDALSARAIDAPYFNGDRFSLVDAAYAPILQRHTYLDRLHPIGVIAKFARVAAWRDALLATPAVKASTVPEIELLWRQNLVRRKRWLARSVPPNEASSVA